MSTPRIIRKYPNRRLYDTEESRYVTLSSIRDLVIAKVDFIVIEKKSGDDITRTILLQIISEQEHQGAAVLSEDFLSQVIRSYGEVIPDFMTRYLEHSLKLFMAQQEKMKSKVKRVTGLDPFSAVTDLTQKNLIRFKMLQDEMLHRYRASRSNTCSDEDVSNAEDVPKSGWK